MRRFAPGVQFTPDCLSSLTWNRRPVSAVYARRSQVGCQQAIATNRRSIRTCYTLVNVHGAWNSPKNRHEISQGSEKVDAEEAVAGTKINQVLELAIPYTA